MSAQQFRDRVTSSLGGGSGASLVGGESVGRVLSVNGSRASVGLPETSPGSASEAVVTVGKFLGIRRGTSLLIGMVTDISIQTLPIAREQGFHATAQLDLMGEIRNDETGTPQFQRGITEYAAIGDSVSLIGNRELRLIYEIAAADTIEIGLLQQDLTIVAYFDVDEMLTKHFAILGTTGVGKSSGVALILQQILQARPNLRIFLIDAHNEYGRCFGERANVVNPRNLRLPFWLFNFEETVDVIFGGRPGIEEEVEILSEVIPLAKSGYMLYKETSDRPTIKKNDPKTTGYTVDTPVPYRLADLISLIDERMGKLENRSSRMNYHRLIMRIETVRNDLRYAFMFENANVGGDTMAEVLSALFRLPPAGKPMTIMQLAGFPAEVVDSVVSVLCRMAFDFGLWSDGAVPLLFVCEEAHRYASADRSIGFGPTRRAISRIAKEGRKYGVYLGLVTQRPAELDATIISQCSTLFAMRMANDRDQAIVRSAVSDAASSLLGFLPSLGTREVFAFGEGVPLPTRLKFKQMPAELLPKSEAVGNPLMDFGQGIDQDFIVSVLDRWRGATMSGKSKQDEAVNELAYPGISEVTSAPAPSLQPQPQPQPQLQPRSLDPDRFKILKKPVGAAPGGLSSSPPLTPGFPSRFPPK